MLGKLIKNEFKAVNRLMIPLHLGLIAVTIIGRFYVQLTIFSNPARTLIMSENIWFAILNGTLIAFYIMALLAVFLITAIYLEILRFRKNLFTDEGYLMHTLPVTAAEHIWSKLIVCVIWTIIDSVLVPLSVFGLFVNMELLRDLPEGLSVLFSSFPEAFGVSAGVGIPLYLLLFLADSVSGILIIYMCIAVGHSFHSHKILSSVGIYVGITTISSIAGMIFSGITGMISMGSMSLVTASEVTFSSPMTFWMSWTFNMVYCIVMGIASFLLTNYFMKKKLNLE